MRIVYFYLARVLGDLKKIIIFKYAFLVCIPTFEGIELVEDEGVRIELRAVNDDEE